MNYAREWLMLNLDRPATGPVYADEYIERWAAVYLANPPLRLFGVPFSLFLARPAGWLLFIGSPIRDELCMRRAEAAVASAERIEGHGENGRLIEKMRHRTHRRGFRDFLPLRTL